jgi:hypothetical protein
MMAQRDTKPDLASAMYPSLSREAKAQEAKNERWQAEQRARDKRLADHLQETIDAVRREKQER